VDSSTLISSPIMVSTTLSSRAEPFGLQSLAVARVLRRVGGGGVGYKGKGGGGGAREAW